MRNGGGGRPLNSVVRPQMKTMALGEIIASRELVFVSGSGTRDAAKVAIGMPVNVPGEHWRCPYRIEGPGFATDFAMVGIDSMQALILTLHTIDVELRVLARDHGGHFEFLEDPDTGFPTTHAS